MPIQTTATVAVTRAVVKVLSIIAIPVVFWILIKLLPLLLRQLLATPYRLVACEDLKKEEKPS